MTISTAELHTLAINTIRTLAIDAVQEANSGHPGLPMGAAPMAYALWSKHLTHNPKNPHWPNRDRFVLSAGHGSMLHYALLHLTGYDLPLEEIKNFRQWGSKTPGHPEYGHTPGIETTTGPLGQGLATGVGLALAEAYLSSYFNRPGHEIIDHYTYILASDGDLMEGVAMEACSLAGHWGLGKLIVLYDDNKITLDGEAEMTFSEDVPTRFQAMGWNTIVIDDGNDVDAVNEAIEAAKGVTEQPSLIAVRTIIGYGSPNRAGTSDAHGKALGEDEVKLTKEAYGWPQEKFYIPPEALDHFREAVTAGEAQEAEWNQQFDAWRLGFPELAKIWDTAFAGVVPEDWTPSLPEFDPEKPVATRNASGKVLNAIAKDFPTMIGGDADLAGSTKTLIDGEASTGLSFAEARNVRFGVREHAMGAIVNGLTLHGGIIKPYSATFLTFSDYMRGAIRIGSLMDIPVLYVFTHDSIGLGEDGPTHQPVEHVMALRTIPNLHVFRPADANESAGVWEAAMRLKHPATLIFTRQNVPALGDNPEGIREGASRGGYVLLDSEGTPDVILIGTGSEVHIALDAADLLQDDDVRVRVVSLPSWELFEAQDEDYQKAVLPPEVTARVSIEAGVTLGWERYVGATGIAIGVDQFGASAPYQRIYEEYGLTAQHVADAAKSLL